MTDMLSPQDVRALLLARREIAILDLREEAPYSDAHPLFAANMPLSRLELEAYDRLPRRDVTIVVYDDGEGVAQTGAERLKALGYTRVHLLEGGLQGWRDAGFELFRDVNSACKAFGELVESRRHTPSLPAPEARALIESKQDLVVLDVRRFEEYNTMSIPRGVSVPGAELVLRAREIAPDPNTTIIVNCAGRTRSIIGTQSLINAGLPNPIFALRNGSIGWTLAGQTLDTGQTRRFPEVSDQTAETARASAREVSYRAGVRRITPAVLAVLQQDQSRTLYMLDVRTPEEYGAGHIPGFVSAPGGQLVQETDVSAPVRGARIVLADDQGVRADMTASWLAQMGWDVMVLDGGFDGPLDKGIRAPERPAAPAVETVTVGDVGALIDAGAVVVDLAANPVFKRGHIPGAWFAIRAQLMDALKRLPQADSYILTSPDGVLARFAAPELAALSGKAVRVLQGGTAAWTGAGLSLEAGERFANEPVDVYRRPYEGTDNAAEAMQAYLDWEYGLIAQLARDGTHGFYVI